MAHLLFPARQGRCRRAAQRGRPEDAL